MSSRWNWTLSFTRGESILSNIETALENGCMINFRQVGFCRTRLAFQIRMQQSWIALASPILISELKVSSNLEIASMFFLLDDPEFAWCRSSACRVSSARNLARGSFAASLATSAHDSATSTAPFEYATHPMLAMKSLASISELLTFSTSSLSCFSTSSVDIFEVLIPCSMTKASLSSLPVFLSLSVSFPAFCKRWVFKPRVRDINPAFLLSATHW